MGMFSQLVLTRRVCRGGARGCGAPPQKSQSEKNREKRRKQLTKSRKFTKIVTMPFTNGTKPMSFRGGNPPHPQFFRNPHLPKSNPAYAPGSDNQKLFCPQSKNGVYISTFWSFWDTDPFCGTLCLLAPRKTCYFEIYFGHKICNTTHNKHRFRHITVSVIPFYFLYFRAKCRYFLDTLVFSLLKCQFLKE